MRHLRRIQIHTPVLLLAATMMWSTPSSALAQDAAPAESGRKVPALAFALSFVVPGAGQAYNGEWEKSAFVLGSTVVAVGLFGFDGVSCLVDDDGENCVQAAVGLGLAGAILLYSWIDAPLTARALNRRIDPGGATAEVGPRLLAPRGSLRGDRHARLSLVRVTF
jgi:hypothetical protein